VAERERLLERVRDTIVGADADRVFQPSDLDALPDRVRTQILASMAPVSLPPGVPLFSQGDQPDAMYVIESGSARVLMTFPETETPIEVGLLGPGQLFGELGVLDGTPRVAAVVSAEEATFLRLDAQTFDELRDAFPELEAVLRAVAAAR
jgi:CRP-like cAMP-binding protein